MIRNGITVSAWKYIGATLVPLALLLLSVLLLVFYLNAEIRLTEKKIQGLRAIRLIHNEIIQLQQIRGLSEVVVQGRDAKELDIQLRQKQFITNISTPQWRNYGIQFGVAGEIAKLQMDSAKLFSIPPSANQEIDRFEQHTRIINGMYRIIRLIADRSSLILDPELDSHHMVDLIINRLPELMGFIGEVRGIGGGIIARDTISNEERMLLGEHLTKSIMAFKQIQDEVNIILATAPQLQELIDPLSNKSEMGLQHFIDMSHLLLVSKSYQFDVEHYFYDGSHAIDAFLETHGKLMDLLNARLVERLESQQNLRSHTVILASLGALLIIYFISSFYRANRAAFLTIERLSISDHLTDLYNRRHLHQVFPQELRRSRREMKSLTFGMLDVDQFKAYNDIYGHPQGDIVLRKVADTLKDALRRAGDFVFRIGGEEFCFLVTGLKENEAKLLLEQIRLRVMALEIEHEGNDATPFVTVSVGTAYLENVTDENMGEIMKCADLALYKAKDMGRNCWHFEEIIAASTDKLGESSDTSLGNNWQI